MSLDQRLREPSPPSSFGGGHTGDDRRQRSTGQARIELPDVLRPRIGRQRPELRVHGRIAIEQQDLGV